MTLLMLLGSVLSLAFWGWTFGAFDGDDNGDGGSDDGGDGGGSDTMMVGGMDDMLNLIGMDGTDEVLEGGSEGDRLQGNEGDDDTLRGMEGDDTLQLFDQNIGRGGEGDDRFVVFSGDTPEDQAVRIQNFDPDEDTLRIISTTNQNFPSTRATVLDIAADGDDIVVSDVRDDGVYELARLVGLDALPLDAIEVLEQNRVGESGRLLTGEALYLRSSADVPEGSRELTFRDAGAVVEVTGTDGDDTVNLSVHAATADLGAGDDALTSDLANTDFTVDVAQALDIDAGAGDDTVQALADFVDVRGEAGNDSIRAVAGQDARISGGDGDDFVRLQAFTGSGVDASSVTGGNGDDTLSVQGDFINVSGGAGVDLLNIEDGSSIIRATGGDGADTFRTSATNVEIPDFDPAEDQLILRIPAGGAGAVSLQPITLTGIGAATQVIVDGEAYAVLYGTYSDLSGISVVEQPAA